MKKTVIFTDLDGTLLDYSTYSFEKALPALDLIKQKDIPLVICSSKTRKEIEHIRAKLGNSHPFISENGGALFIPKKYFMFTVHSTQFTVEESYDYDVVSLGTPYSELRTALCSLRKKGYEVKGFGDMSVGEVAEVTGLDITSAEMAKERDFDEPFIFNGDREKEKDLLDSIRSLGLNYTRGNFYHLLGNSDKGKAVAIMIEYYKKSFGAIQTMAIGDHPNDVPMLEQADYRVIVQHPDGTYDFSVDLPNLIKAEGIGPDGWNRAILHFLATES
jgi:mannosyl-3-phosphoglycerate phosphatase